MYISNAKILAIPFSIIIYVSIFAILFTYSAKMVVDMMHKMNFEMTEKNTKSSVLQQTKIQTLRW